MQEKKLLREWVAIDLNKDLIVESKEKNGGKLIFPATLQKAQAKNQNGRIYPRNLLEREVENYKKIVKDNRALGECDHPDNSTVSLQNASHIVREIYWEGDKVKGIIEVLSTPAGKILESLLVDDVKIGISSRGVGSTEQTNEGVDVVQDDFTLICFDAVSEPSTPGAFINEQTLKNSNYKQALTKEDRIWRAANNILMR